MHSESALARRRRRIYHQRSSHQSSGGSLGSYTQTLIPEEAEEGEVHKNREEEEEEEEEEDEELNNERASLIRAPSSAGGGTSSSPRAVRERRHLRRRLHSAGSGECQYLEVGQKADEEEKGEERGEEEDVGWEEAGAAASVTAGSQQPQTPPQPHQPQRAVSPGALLHHQPPPAAKAGRVAGGAPSLLLPQQQQHDDARIPGMTIPPAGSSHHHHHQQQHAGICSSGGGGGEGGEGGGGGVGSGGGGRPVSPANSAPSSAASRGASSVQHAPGAEFSSSGGVGATGQGPAGTGCADVHVHLPTGGSLLTTTAGGGGAGGGGVGVVGGVGAGGAGGGGGAPRTPIVKKRTRFQQRSVTMMPATSPVLAHRHGGSVDEMYGDRHQQLDLATTYHSGVQLRGGGGGGGGNNNQRTKHHLTVTTTATTLGRHLTGSGKTSTPSLLFTKVKERIREKVFQSSEWPNAAAMMHEKRQRANDMLEASLNSRTNLNLEQIQLHGKQRKKSAQTQRCKSDPTGGRTSGGSGGSGAGQGALQPAEPLVVAPSARRESGGSPEDPGSPEKDRFRHAFRRRSISEDTYDRQPCVIMKKNGIVCSNEDLEVIMQEQQSIQHSKAYKKHRSPRPLKKHLRTQSLDIARLTARENAAAGAGAGGGAGGASCCHSSIYLDPQASMESSSSTVSSVHTIDSASSDINLALRSSSLALDASGCRDVLGSPSGHLYPEIVLDVKSKEIIMEETKDGDNNDDGESEDEDDDVSIEDDAAKMDGKPPKKSNAVPEIVFDENGQTWDVYGAEFDPEVLGIAIQRHLEKMMEQMMAPVMETEIDTDADAINAAATAIDAAAVDAGSNQGRIEKTSSEPNSFWVRLLCLFAGRSDVAT